MPRLHLLPGAVGIYTGTGLAVLLFTRLRVETFGRDLFMRERGVSIGVVPACAGTEYTEVGGAGTRIFLVYAGIVYAGAAFKIYNGTTGPRDNPESRTYERDERRRKDPAESLGNKS